MLYFETYVLWLVLNYNTVLHFGMESSCLLMEVSISKETAAARYVTAADLFMSSAGHGIHQNMFNVELRFLSWSSYCIATGINKIISQREVETDISVITKHRELFC